MTPKKIPTLLASLMFALLASATQAQDSVVLTQVRLGNIFLSTETVEIAVQTTGDEVSWTVTDFFGVSTSGPATPVGPGGQVVIAPGLGRLGYFDLQVTALRQGSPVASADTTFAVVAPCDVSTMHQSPFGVVTHFAHGAVNSWTTDILPLLARGGIAHFRDEQEWDNVETTLTTPATYDFSEYQPYMNAAASLGLKPLITLDFANPNYDGGYSPYTPGGRTGYANYGTALLDHYFPQVDTVAVWNEYNGLFFANPDPNPNRPEIYTEMLKTAYTAVGDYATSTGRPRPRVLGGASVPVPLPWFEDLFSYGAVDYLDAMDVHPYRSIPEGVETILSSLQNLSAFYNDGVPKPIWATECGGPDLVNQGRQDMARYLVRLMTLMRTAGVERAYWYLAHDYQVFSTGLLRSPTDPLGTYVPSSAFSAYSTLIQQLYNASYVGPEDTDARTRLYHFNRPSGDVRVAWSTLGTAELVLSTNTPLTRVDIMGESTVLQPTHGAIALTVDETPFFLLGSIDSVREIGRDIIVADSIRDYSGTVGATQVPSNGSWYYGNCFVAEGTEYDPNELLPMDFTRTPYDYLYSSYFAFARIDTNGGHPSARYGYFPDPDHPVWTVRRWLSDREATARITGTIVRGDSRGDGTGVGVYVDGVSIYSTIIGGSGVGEVTQHFDVSAPIQIGSKVDFVVTPGPGNEINFDYVDFRAQISIPRPALATSYAAWQEQNFTLAEIVDPAISGDNAAPAGDGVHNLIKYSANANAKTFASTALPLAGSHAIGNDSYLTFSYRKASAPTDVTFITEVNPGDLSPTSWVPGGVPVGSPVDNGDGTVTVTVRDVVPITPQTARRFMRLRVTRP